MKLNLFLKYDQNNNKNELIFDGNLILLNYSFLFKYNINKIVKIYKILNYVTRLGSLSLFKLLIYNHSIKITYKIIEIAALFGKLNIIKYIDEICDTNKELFLPKNSESYIISSMVFDNAVEYGHFETVLWLHHKNILNKHKYPGPSHSAIDFAASNGKYDIIKWLLENRDDAYFTHDAIDLAAKNGHLNIINLLYHYHLKKWNQSKHIQFCDLEAIVNAAGNGHFHVLEWFYHENIYQMKFTKRAMDIAAQNGHLKIVIWLHEMNLIDPKRFQACSDNALNYAIFNCHYEIIKFLLKERPELYTPQCLIWVRRNQTILDIIDNYLN